MKKIIILATGGTIAATANSKVSSQYKAGKLTINQLADSVPGLDKLAKIEYKQIYNKDSGNVTLEDWLKLADAVDKISKNNQIDAIVITHGTDTLEETAYFLNLVVKTNKPIILVGAMRAATSLSADGPLNLYNAVAVAINPNSVGRGVLVVMNDYIFDGRNVTKTNTSNVNAFIAPNVGAIGHVVMGKVSYNTYIIMRPHTLKTTFTVTLTSEIPKVIILYEHAGIDNIMLFNILRDETIRGIVIAGVGDGNIPNYTGNFLKQARKQNIVIVRSSRVRSGSVSCNYNNLDKKYNLITADDLNPEKARVLLMLSLMETSNLKTIQKNFYTY